MIVGASALRAIRLGEADAARHAVAPQLAWSRYGRGRHPGKRNIGDCMADGFAKVEQLPLLFEGHDVPLTDTEPALKD